MRTISGFSSVADYRQVAVRAAAASFALVSNLMVARCLDIGEVAYYFTFATIAYFGNASLFVGASVYLQRRLSFLASGGAVPRKFLLRYILSVSAIGGGLVMAGAIVYFVLLRYESMTWAVLICAGLSISTFLSNVTRDLWALQGKASVSAWLSLLENGLKCLLFAGAALLASRLAAGALLALAAAAAASVAIVGGLRLLSSGSNEGGEEPVLKSGMAGTIVPLGVGAILNWIQLQVYRPLLLYLGGQAPAIGATSLLTTLGSTGANPVLSVVVQRFIPGIYRRDPGSVPESLSRILLAACALALLAMPAAYFFLILSGRRELIIYLPLVAVGVLTEAANSAIGVIMHNRNSRGRSLWPVSLATGIGAVVVLAVVMLPVSGSVVPYVIGGGLVLSQVVVFSLVCFANRRLTGG